MRKIIISEDQVRPIIAEKMRQKNRNFAGNVLQEVYLYHRGRDVDVDNPEPYRSENRWRKWEGSGHETGTFGSGMYFTSEDSYDNRFNDREKDDIFNAKYDATKDGEKFIKIGEGLYRVDTDFFKNLYVLKSEKEGDLLVELMEAVNSYVRYVAYDSHKSTKNRQRLWMMMQHYSKLLGLRVPWDYRGLYEFAVSYVKDESIRQTPSTIFMEMNGYNGVDATRAGKYNSYWQGSVIYDLSKVSDITPVSGPRDEFKLRYYGELDRTMTDDALSRKDSTSYYRDGKYGSAKEDPEQLLKALKRYPYVLEPSKFWSLPNEIKPKYLSMLYNNIRTGYVTASRFSDTPIKRLMDKEYIKNIILYKAVKFINLDPKLTEALLHEFSWGFTVDKETVLMFLNAYQGNIAQDYPEDWEEIKSEYSL